MIIQPYEVHSYLLHLLKQLEEKVTPPQGCHHAIMFRKYGSDESGWEDKLVLQMSLSSGLWNLFLEELDFSRATDVLIADITKLLPAQSGYGGGGE